LGGWIERGSLSAVGFQALCILRSRRDGRILVSPCVEKAREGRRRPGVPLISLTFACFAASIGQNYRKGYRSKATSTTCPLPQGWHLSGPLGASVSQPSR
jgi:hypothetical protein